MATQLKCFYAGKGNKMAAAKKVASSGPIASFVLTDDPGKPGSYVVNGRNANGDVIDTSATATIGVVAGDPTTNTPTVTGPNAFTVQGLKAGPATDTITMTANDGSFGPFTGDVAFQINPGPISGFDVTVAPVVPVVP